MVPSILVFTIPRLANLLQRHPNRVMSITSRVMLTQMTRSLPLKQNSGLGSQNRIDERRRRLPSEVDHTAQRHQRRLRNRVGQRWMRMHGEVEFFERRFDKPAYRQLSDQFAGVGPDQVCP